MTDLNGDFGKTKAQREARQRGVEIFGYSPDDMRANQVAETLSAKCSRLFSRFRNSKAVVEAKATGYKGDWKSTRVVLKALGKFAGIHLTNGR